MIKKKVLAFFTILLAMTTILGIVHISSLKSTTGFVIIDPIENPIIFSEKGDLSAQIYKYSREGNILLVNYFIQDLSNNNREAKISYYLQDSENYTLSKSSQAVILSASQNNPYIIRIPLAKYSYGNFILNMNIISEKSNIILNKTIYLSEANLTGLAISDENKGALQTGIFVIISIALLSYIAKKAYLIRLRRKKLRSNINNHFIKLDVKHG